MKYIFSKYLLLIILISVVVGYGSIAISAELSSAITASAETGNDDTGDADETAGIEAQTGGTGGDAQRWLDEALGNNEESRKLWGEGDNENSLKALDRAYGSILKVDAESHPDLGQQVDDLRFVISKRILEIYASRNTTVQGNHRAIPLDMNRHVEREIRLLQGEGREFFLKGYKRSGRYRDEIVHRLKEAGLPEELSWLPLVESGFDVRALSSARALGLWQFIPSTGYKFGLQRDSWIDERLDPGKSTDAAIDYLKDLHRIFGDWTSVLAAYNCGAGRVLKVIREQRINYLDNFWDLYERLPHETARYVPRFLAVLQIVNDPEKYGFDLEESDDPPLIEVVSIQKQVRLKAVAEKIGVSSNELIELNPELRYEATPPSPYDLKVPPGTGPALLSKIDEIPVWTPAKKDYAYHRVKKGDTVSSIARKYRTSVEEISRLNKIGRKGFIRVGQKLKVPVQGGVRTADWIPTHLPAPSTGKGSGAPPKG